MKNQVNENQPCSYPYFALSGFDHFRSKGLAKGNVVIITIDGFRWQELFRGADEAFLRNSDFVQDTTLLNAQFHDSNPAVRRQKLMPFFWSVIAKHGQLYGNRDENNKVNAGNLYKISYPGYSEIFTGYNSLRFNPNLPVPNRNTNILEFLNTRPEYEGKVAVFSSWNIFPFILNETRSNIPINSGYEMLDETADTNNILINKVQQSVATQSNTRHDLLTFAAAKEYIAHNHPKVAVIGFGETDDLAHGDHYDLYLQKANQIDGYIAALWYYLQTDPFYKGNTTLVITTDHGRGRAAATWHTHGLFTGGSGETWLALLGPGILPQGEMKTQQQLYQKQISQTVAAILGFQFTANHPVGKAIALPAADDELAEDAATQTSLLLSVQK